MNVVMTADGRLVEVQATAERDPFSRELLDELLDLAAGGIEEITVAQNEAIASERVPDLSTTEALLRLLIAAGLGGAIGLERELRDHEAGFRTHLLVSLGACVFTLVSAYAWTDWTFSTASGVVFDPTRIAAQIVTGIGFLGAGAIIVRGISVRGLTTAATLWVVAAIGMAAGTGYYEVAVGAAALVLVSLGPLKLVERAAGVARPAGGGGARDQACAAGGRGDAGAGADRGARRRIEYVEFGDERTVDVVLRRLAPGGVGARGGGGREARRRRARAVAAVEPGAARLAGTRTSSRSCARRCRAGSSSCSRPRSRSRRRRARRYDENARAKAQFGRAASARRTSGCSARTPASRWPRSAAAPGSRRRAGPRTASRELLEELAGVERPARPVRLRARLRSRPDGEERRGTGTLEGTIATERRGEEGFGYDPIFVPLAAQGGGEERTVAELGDAWKRQHSHRARAAAARLASQSALDYFGAGPRSAPVRTVCYYARPATSSSSRRAYHQLTSAPKTITFAIT